jgi:hypothetical protein
MIIFALLFIAMFFVIKYCKKTMKIVLSSIIILVILYFSMLFIDINRVNSFHKPIFVWNPTTNVGTNEISYQGIGYKVDIKYYDNGIVETIEMYMFGKVIAGGVQDIVTNSSELNAVYKKIGEYFVDENADRSNLASNRLDTTNNVVVVELIDNGKAKQENFLKNAKIDSKYSKYIRFEQGGSYYTSDKCNSDGLKIITGEIKEINNPNYKSKNSKGNIIINIISGLDSEDDIVFYHNSNTEFKMGQKVRIGYNGDMNLSNPPQTSAECIELLQ